MRTRWQRLLIEAMVSVMLIVLSVVGLLFLFSWLPVFRALYLSFFVKKTAYLKKKNTTPFKSVSLYICHL